MSYIKKIKCLIQQVNNLLLYKPKLEYNLDNNILTSTYINGQQASTEIPLSSGDPHIPLVTGNTDDPEVNSGTAVVQSDARQLVAYDKHLAFEEHPNGGSPQLVSMLRLSDEFLSTINTINYVEGTWAEFNALIEADELIPGQVYILTDYQTEYFILGSNSSGRTEVKTISANISGWAVLNDNYEYDLGVGDTVEITELPSGYSGSLQVGDTTTVSQESSDYYFRFANGMQSVVGLKFKFYFDRYNTIAQDIVVNDSYGKPVMKPMGVINTEVHDGTPYMEQTASENLDVPVERIVLVASDTNSFRKEAESDTFQGDYLEYDFHDTDIVNDNDEVIGTRKGLITRRATFDRSIDIPIDWRVVRFRRWLLDLNSRTQFCNRDLDPNTTRVGYNGLFLFESNNRNPSQTNPFYIGKLPEGEFQKINANAMRTTFQYLAEDLAMAKDFNCFSIDSNYEPVNISSIKVKDGWFNTVLVGMAGEYSYQATLELNSGIVSGTTFMSNPGIYDAYGTTFNNCTLLDSIYMIKPISLQVDNCQFLSHFTAGLVNSVQFYNCVFGTLNSNVNGMNVTYAWNIFNRISNSIVRDSVFGHRTGYAVLSNTVVSLSSLFLGASWCGSGDDCTLQKEIIMFDNCNLSNFGIRMLAQVDRVIFEDAQTLDSNNVTGNPNNLFLYDYTSSLSRVVLNMNRYDFRLYRTNIDTNDQISIVTLMTPL